MAPNTLFFLRVETTALTGTHSENQGHLQLLIDRFLKPATCRGSPVGSTLDPQPPPFPSIPSHSGSCLLQQLPLLQELAPLHMPEVWELWVQVLPSVLKLTVLCSWLELWQPIPTPRVRGPVHRAPPVGFPGSQAQSYKPASPHNPSPLRPA